MEKGTDDELDDLDLSLSVVLELPRRDEGPYDLETIYQELKKNINEESIVALGTLQAYYQCTIVLKSEYDVEKLVALKHLCVDGQRGYLTKQGRKFVDIRVYWLPIQLPNSVVAEIFKPYGAVTSIVREKCSEPGLTHLFSGSRLLSLELKEGVKKENLPHLADVEDFPALIMVKGRKPMCLRCKEYGHIFRNCPRRKKNQASSYAAAVQQKLAAGEEKEREIPEKEIPQSKETEQPSTSWADEMESEAERENEAKPKEQKKRKKPSNPQKGKKNRQADSAPSSNSPCTSERSTYSRRENIQAIKNAVLDKYLKYVGEYEKYIGLPAYQDLMQAWKKLDAFMPSQPREKYYPAWKFAEKTCLESAVSNEIVKLKDFPIKGLKG